MACICALMRAPGEARRAGRPERGAGGEAAGERAGLCWPGYARGGGTSAGVCAPRPPDTAPGDGIGVRWVRWRGQWSLGRWDGARLAGRAFQMKRGAGRRTDLPFPCATTGETGAWKEDSSYLHATAQKQDQNSRHPLPLPKGS